MKIKNLTKNTTKLLKLKLIKTKIYKKKLIDNHLTIENIEHKLKKFFQVIYKYHVKQKKILFLSLSFIPKIKSLLKNTRHEFLIEANWISGNITNNKVEKFENKYDLIVILESSIDKKILEESYKAQIPVIIIQNKTEFSNMWYSYDLPGNFSFNKKKIRNNFFLNLLQIIFRKVKINK